MASAKPTKQELVERATKALVDEARTFYISGNQSVTGRSVFEDRPKYSLKQVLQMVRADSVAWGGIITLLDKMLENGWEIVDSKTGERLPINEQMLKNKDFDNWLREMSLHFIIFQNAFGEIVYTPQRASVKEIHTIDPTLVKIETDEHNKVLKYWQANVSSGQVANREPQWEPEEILHISEARVEMSNWGEISMRSIYEAVAIKYHIKKFMLWLFETNQFRGIYNPKNADEQAIKLMISYLKESERDISKPVIAVGEFEYMQMREFKDLKTLNDLLYKMDEEILNLLQVPPIYAGLPDNSNRSNSDAQERALNTRVKNLQKIFEFYINKLLVRMGIFKSNFRFKPSNRKDIRETLELAEIMKNSGFKTEIISDFLRREGLTLPQGDVFQEPMEFSPMDENRTTTGQAKGAPSRRGKGVGEGNKRIGTGEESTTRPEQISRTWNFPYMVSDDAV